MSNSEGSLLFGSFSVMTHLNVSAKPLRLLRNVQTAGMSTPAFHLTPKIVTCSASAFVKCRWKHGRSERDCNANYSVLFSGVETVSVETVLLIYEP